LRQQLVEGKPVPTSSAPCAGRDAGGAPPLRGAVTCLSTHDIAEIDAEIRAVLAEVAGS
jgi:hypothetical protein